MAHLTKRRAENVPGDLFVDATCIDCDTCRWMAPETFARRAGMSAVVRQPGTDAERRRALEALVSCPTASIGTATKAPGLPRVADSFPIPVAGDVHHCGYHSASSFGATSYFVRRPEGNILVDAPRFAAPLVRRLEEMGGVTRILLTHRDDVADGARYAGHFGAEAWIHERDARALPGASTWSGDDPQPVAPGLTMIPVPGHTAGHVAFHLDAPEGPFLFTGDHLAYDDAAGTLEAWPDACWFDWGQQTASMRRLLDWPFAWVLPGHGRRGHRPPAEMRAELAKLVAWMQSQ